MHIFSNFVLLAAALAVSILFASFLAAKIAGKLAYRQKKLRDKLPDIASTFSELQEARSHAGNYMGMEALFGCGHRQRIQLMDSRGAFIMRNVVWNDAWHKNCHACWFRTGDELALPQAAPSEAKDPVA